jgi:hypothetical protein
VNVNNPTPQAPSGGGGGGGGGGGILWGTSPFGPGSQTGHRPTTTPEIEQGSDIEGTSTPGSNKPLIAPALLGGTEGLPGAHTGGTRNQGTSTPSAEGTSTTSPQVAGDLSSNGQTASVLGALGTFAFGSFWRTMLSFIVLLGIVLWLLLIYRRKKKEVLPPPAQPTPKTK